ncbi:MAG: alpha/beta hydrolase [Firmicutes bacterium]|nr:alpha/beta hydrolase [Alicyclobacillaceae bacterium]MCL6497117.1 alpha/beta hydrolase [Bacillota bacterium]
MGAVHDNWLDIRGHRLHYLWAEGGTGTPVVFLHGAGGAGPWFDCLDRLSVERPVYYPEHPGFGASDLPDWLETVTDLALYYWDVFDRLGLERVNLIGASFGGWLAAELAVQQPQRVARLVLVDAVGVMPPTEDAPDFFMIPPDQVGRWVFAHPDRIPPAPPPDPAIAVKNRTTVARFAWHPRFYNPKLRHWLYRIQCPTLVVWGREDRLIPPAMAEPYLAGIPQAQLVLIDDAGHVPWREQPERFLSAVRSHLQGA